MQPDDMTCRISCLCGTTVQRVTLDASANCVRNLCHCTACRTASGLLCSLYYPLKSSPLHLGSFAKYEQPSGICRFFCKTCGSHVFALSIASGQYFVAGGLLEIPPEPRSSQHWGAEDTRDGGLTAFLPAESEVRDTSCWLQYPSVRPSRFEHAIQKPDGDGQELQARCECGGIELYITPPDITSAEPSSPWPDLLVPYHSKSSENPTDVKWWLQDNQTKYLAGFCACRTCRLASGFPIQSWAFVPKSNIRNADRSPLTFGFAGGTMQRYESAPGIFREFCNRCGATVFWHCEERQLVIDVSVGLLQASTGARAEQWLSWATGRVSFAELAVDRSLVQQMEAGLRDWGGKQAQT